MTFQNVYFVSTEKSSSVELVNVGELSFCMSNNFKSISPNFANFANLKSKVG